MSENNSNGNNVLGKIVTFWGLGCLIPLTLFCLALTAVTVIIVANLSAPANTEAVMIAPTPKVLPTVIADEPALKPTPIATETAETERVCKYSDGFDANGKVVPSGTTVHGPGLVKPDRNRDHAILVMPGSNYITTATDEVIWTLIGDSACVLSQGQFFGSTEIQ